MIRAHVYDLASTPLSGVQVTVVDHPELGATITQADGALDMAVNGGQTVRLRFNYLGYLQAERTVRAPVQDYAVIDDVVLLKPDTQVTALDLSGAQAGVQLARGSTTSDDLGSRTATLVVPVGTEAAMTSPDGNVSQLTEMSLRSTEYSVAGAAAMPGTLPSATGYAYAVELNSDEARRAGALKVELSQPVGFYVENYLGLPVGSSVPHGFYDAVRGTWIPDANGRVVRVLNPENGLANLDVTGDGAAASGAALTALGITPEERVTIANTYSTGQTLWRVPIEHFSAHAFGLDKEPKSATSDCITPACHAADGHEQPCTTAPWTKDYKTVVSENDVHCPYAGAALYFGCLGDECNYACCDVGYSLGIGGKSCGDTDEGAAASSFKCDAPDPPVPSTGDGPGSCEQPHASTIRCQRQSLGEDIPIAGTPYVLHYESDRQRGRQGEVTIPVTGAHPPQGLLGVDLRISVAGRVFTQTLDAQANRLFPFAWDGTDVYGRSVQGGQPIIATIISRFAGIFRSTETFGLLGSGLPLTDSPPSQPQRSSKTWTGSIGVWDAQPTGLGGWSLNIHHAYDVSGRALRFGNGDNYTLTDVPSVIQTVAGTGSAGIVTDGGQATASVVNSPAAIAVDGDGSVYVADGQSCVRRIDETGVVHPFAGQCATAGFAGDGGPATSARLRGPTDLSIGPDGSLYISDQQNNRIRRVGKDGVIRTVAGSGATGASAGSFSGDGGDARTATLSSPSGVDVGIDGIIYIVDSGNQRIRSVSPDGVIRTVAGNGASTASGNYGAATSAGLGGPRRVRIAPDGALFIAEQTANMVRRVARGGTIYPVAGNTTPGYWGDGGPAINALLKGPTDFAFGSDGALLILDQNNTVRSVSATGVISTLLGSATNNSYSGDNLLAAAATFGSAQGIHVAQDGSLYVACTTDNRVRRVAPALTGFKGGSDELKFPSSDARELYVFNARGRHLRTEDALTGAALTRFGYDLAGRLTAATDVDGKVTHFNHDAEGKPTEIIGPFGQKTVLHVDSNNYLDTVTDPIGWATAFTYDAGGLMATKTDANGRQAHYYYDSFGRLAEDDDAAGGFKVLTRTTSASGFTVTSTSALNRATSFATGVSSAGVFSRTNTDPSGLSSKLQFSYTGVTTVTTPDKITTTTKQIADPRYGMLAPTLSVTTTLPPSGTTDPHADSNSINSPDNDHAVRATRDDDRN